MTTTTTDTHTQPEAAQRYMVGTESARGDRRWRGTMTLAEMQRDRRWALVAQDILASDAARTAGEYVSHMRRVRFDLQRSRWEWEYLLAVPVPHYAIVPAKGYYGSETHVTPHEVHEHSSMALGRAKAYGRAARVVQLHPDEDQEAPSWRGHELDRYDTVEQ